MQLRKQLMQLLEAVVQARQETPDRSFLEIIASLPAQFDNDLLHIAYDACAPFDFTGLIFPETQNVDRYFREWCAENGVVILRKLQEGQTGKDLKAHVYLVLDSDGIVKVFKELVVRQDSEIALYERLEGLSGIPKLYGIVEVQPGVMFLRLEMCYGQDLSDWVRDQKTMTSDEARFVIWKLAQILREIHARGILYLDLKPENIRVNGKKVSLLDFNASRFHSPDLHTHVMEARYAPPETVISGTASCASEVFQLGILFHELLTGQHPFALKKETSEEVELRILNAALPAAVLAPALASELDQSDRDFIEAMLEWEASQRPDLDEVISHMQPTTLCVRHVSRRESRREREQNTVLFPARMGLPHKGHIDFIARLLELGYFIRISLQCCYVITAIDPYPKWIVAKMIAQSLFRLGFAPEDFEIVLTPLFETQQEIRMHFAMMPGAQDIVAVASSNSGVQDLFPGLPLLTQRCVFGQEGEEYETRSWGESLRRAVREGDRKTFDELVAPGVLDIMSFEELRETYAQVPVEFVRGTVRVELVNSIGLLVIQSRIRRYESPELALVRACRESGLNFTITDAYVRDSSAIFQGEPVCLRYESMRVDEQGNEIIRYRI